MIQNEELEKLKEEYSKLVCTPPKPKKEWISGADSQRKEEQAFIESLRIKN